MNGYEFLRAVIRDASGNEIQIDQIGRRDIKEGLASDYHYQYHQVSDGTWHDIGNTVVYFIYRLDNDWQSTSDLDTVTTVDSISDGINISLFDYDKTAANAVLGNFGFGNEDERGDGAWNAWSSGNGSTQGIMQNTLQNGYPAFSSGIGGGAGASWLFTPENDFENKKTVYTGLNHLFWIDDEGYYYYNSENNFASITAVDTSSENYAYPVDGDFVVYSVGQDPSDDAQDTRFMPFNTISEHEVLSGTANRIDQTRNYAFGMQVDFAFIQPSGGKIQDDATSNDMIFEFSGDDDVWVYIDDVLVLDIGGIHGAISGTINFATGDVNVSAIEGNNIHKYPTTLYDLYKDALGEENLNPDDWRTETDGSKKTFADYTDHTFKFYYLERGEGGSNLEMKFNIQSIPTGSVYVNKEYEGATSSEPVTMQLLLDTDGDGTFTSAVNDATHSYTYRLTSEEESADKPLGANATFPVTPGQPVYVSGMDVNVPYKIVEVNVDTEQYEVTFNGTAGTVSDGNVNSSAYMLSGSDATNAVTVTNKARTATLTIKKTVTGYTSTTKTYDINIIDESGQLNGKTFDGYTFAWVDPDNQQGATQITVSLRADGETAITGLPLNIQLKVQEAAASQDVIDDGKNIAGADYYLDSTTYNGQVAEACTITMDSNKEVTVANTYKPYSTVTVTKSVLGEMGSYEDWFNFSVTKTDGEVVDVDKDTDETTTEEGYAFRLQNGDTVTLINLKPGDVIQVSEQTSASGYKIDDIKYSTDSIFSEDQNRVVTISIPDTVTMPTNYGTVEFVNKREAVAPTGLESNHTTPYVLMITAAGMAGLALIGGIVARRVRRRRQE